MVVDQTWAGDSVGALVPAALVRPPVVAARDDQVELVVAARAVEAAGAVLGGVEAARARLPREALGVADPHARGSAGGRYAAAVRAGRDAQDLPVQDARVLAAAPVARVARAHVHGAVGAEADAAGGVDRAHRDAADDDAVERHRRARPAPPLHLHLGADGGGEVDERLAGGEGRVERDAEQAALAVLAHVERRRGRGRQRAVRGDHPHLAGPLRHQRPAVGQERDVPRNLESRGDDAHLGRPVRAHEGGGAGGGREEGRGREGEGQVPASAAAVRIGTARLNRERGTAPSSAAAGPT